MGDVQEVSTMILFLITNFYPSSSKYYVIYSLSDGISTNFVDCIGQFVWEDIMPLPFGLDFLTDMQFVDDVDKHILTRPNVSFVDYWLIVIFGFYNMWSF